MSWDSKTAIEGASNQWSIDGSEKNNLSVVDHSYSGSWKKKWTNGVDIKITEGNSTIVGGSGLGECENVG